MVQHKLHPSDEGSEEHGDTRQPLEDEAASGLPEALTQPQAEGMPGTTATSIPARRSAAAAAAVLPGSKANFGYLSVAASEFYVFHSPSPEDGNPC